MKITKDKNNETLTLAIEGRLETTSAPELEEVINSNLSGIKELILDLSGLEYISSAGLRVILSAQKIMKAQGQMTLKGVNEVIKDVFDITGFSEFLTIV